MKKSTIILCLTAIFAALPFMAPARQLSPTQALGAALAQKQGAMRMPSASAREMKPCYTMSQDGSNTLYVFNIDGGGYIIVSADDVANPLLGYSDTGTFDANNIPENLQGWLQSYSNQIVGAIDANMPAFKAPRRAASSKPQVQPITKTLWNQSAPYNNQCPILTSGNTEGRAVTGCVATAMAQVMKVHNWPPKGTGSKSYTFYFSGNNYTQSLDFDTISYDWQNMADTYTSTSTPEQQQAVATLMHSCGVSVSMSYGLSESGAQGYNAGLALVNNFGYDKGMAYLSHSYIPADEWEQTIYNELAAGHPVLYFGQGSEGGHAFVCDGYSDEGYFHFNWGWAGLSDGYYVLTALDPPALGIGGAGGGFNSDQQIIVGIQPAQEGSIPTAVMVLQGTLVPMQQSYNYGQEITFAAESGGAFIGSLSLSKINATLGFKLTDAQGNVQYIQSDVVNHSFSSMSGYGTLSILASQFPAGTYTVTPAFEYNGEWQDVMMELDYPFTLTATSDGETTVSFSLSQNAPALSVTSFDQNTDIYIGSLCEFTTGITAASDYYGEVTPILLQSDSEVAEADALTVSFAAGETKDLDWVTKFSGNGLTPGTYTLNFLDDDDNLLCNGYTVTINAQSDETPSVNVVNITFGSSMATGRTADPIMLNANDLNIVVTLQCTQGFWADYVEGMFFDTTTLREAASTQGVFIGLDSGETGNIVLTGTVDGLVPGNTYYFTPWAVNNKKQLGSPYLVMIKTADTDIEMVTDDNTPEAIYNLQGEQMPTDTKLTPGIYIVRKGGMTTKEIIRQ